MANQPTCSGMVGFGSTAKYLHHCDVDVWDSYSDRIEIRIDPKSRERDKPVRLMLEGAEALSLLRRLSEVLQPQSEFAETAR